MLPGLRAYFDRMPRPHVDGGYYTRTAENRPLIGPLQIGGAFVAGAVSGFGIMSACAVGELLAAHVCQTPLPAYAAAFLPDRYSDPEYSRQFDDRDDSGQL
jgi:glycine/D-amino acid oxidase-like deaminating enzyme